MFSEFIQNLLNTSGQSTAMQRYAQLSQKVNANNNAQNPLDTLYPNSKVNNTPSFEKVMAASSGVNFGSLLTNPNLRKVSAELLQNGANVSELNQALQSESSMPVGNVNDAKAPKSQILNIVSQVSKKYDVDEKLIQAVIKQESGFNSKDRSKAGAMGLMQLMPSTAKHLGVKDPFNPVQNVEGGVKYLKSMLNKYHGNVILALAAYNAGSGAVDKYDGVPPYAETQNYVKNILANYL